MSTNALKVNFKGNFIVKLMEKFPQAENNEISEEYFENKTVNTDIEI